MNNLLTNHANKWVTRLPAPLVVLVFLGITVIYASPFFDNEFRQVFSSFYADAILLTPLIVLLSFRLRYSRSGFERLFWLFLNCSLLSWLIFSLVRLSFWNELSENQHHLISNVSYFLFYAFTLSAIEISSRRQANRFLSPSGYIVAFSVFFFILGAFIYFVLLPSDLFAANNAKPDNAFLFYLIFDGYIAIRWFHYAWKLRPVNTLAYLFFGLASLNWLIADLFEYRGLMFGQLEIFYWADWIWYTPYLFLYLGIHYFSYQSVEKLHQHSSSENLLNSPVFFLGIISIGSLISSVFIPDQLSQLIQFQAVWVTLMLLLAVYQWYSEQQNHCHLAYQIAELKDENDSFVRQTNKVITALKSENSANQLILTTINNPIFTLDLCGKILSINPAAQHLLGYQENDIIGRFIKTIVSPEDAFYHFFDYQSYRQKLTKSSSGIELESLLLNANGQATAVHITLSQGTNEARNIIIATITDIRQQKQAQDELNNLREEFAANISHEFRTPLTIIGGVISELEQSKQSPSTQQIAIVKRHNLRLLHLVDQLLASSRATGQSIPLENIGITAIIESVGDSYRVIAESRNIDFQISIQPGVWVLGNQQAIENILYNLLSNAFKYTPKGGKINLVLESENYSNFNNSNLPDPILIIRDSGVGISKADQQTIFNRYQRVKSAEESAIPGVGIGLSLVKELVDAMNWTIAVQSEDQNGTVFTVTMKRGQHQATLKKASIEQTKNQKVNEAEISQLQSTFELADIDSPGEPSKYLILVVEDDPDMQKYIESIIKPRHQVLIANDGAQGISIAEETLPDLIVSDIMMPKLSGIDMLNKLKANHVTTHIPIILLTAKSDRETKIQGLLSEANDYLTKPFDAKELSLKIDNLFKTRKKLQQQFELRWKSFETHTVINKTENLDEQFIGKINQLFESRYRDQKYSMSLLADDLAMSERQLQRKIKALVNVTPLELLKRFRLEKAKVLLETDQQIGIIAQSCGFSSQTYFGRCFKELYGMTPKDYRAKT